MSRRLLAAIAAVGLTACVATHAAAQAQTQTPIKASDIARYMDIASPLELNSARKADRVAWITFERGMRNVYTAAAPAWKPLRITRFLDDDGQELRDVRLSDDGTIAVFVRGADPNRDGWVANPAQDPDGSERAIWAAATDGSGAWRIAEGNAPQLSPDGRSVVYVKGGQIYRARTARRAQSALAPRTAQDSIDRGVKPLIKAWGTQSNPRWSPDGARIAFTSNRTSHSFVGVYDVLKRSVVYVSPGVDFDANPVWSPDSRRIAFTRRPGQPFGQQRPNDSLPRQAPIVAMPGMYSATFVGGYTLSLMVAEVANLTMDLAQPAPRELWHNAPNDRVFNTIGAMYWGKDAIIFRGATSTDEWDRYYAIRLSDPSQPVLLTTTNGLIEDATSVALSKDGATLYYTTNAGDIERRHIWAVPSTGGTPRQVTSGDGIETYPQPLASGRNVAVLYFGAKTPASVGIAPVQSTGATKLIYPTLPASWARHVTPEIVITRAADSMQIHNQLFLPSDLKPGEKRPAIVFVHGGPQRQMLPGYHYMQFYHWAYGANQWLADQGYIVLSVNFRSGIGYGRSFTRAPRTGRAGNSEYQDVVAGARYLMERADVDASRIGIWGLSYGGQLTSQALARNSDIFVAGVDMAGVHTLGPLDTAGVAYRSAAISQIDGWKSPVLLVHGDDDRNVAFTQTVGLVQLLRARGVYHELIVVPDDVHESMLYSRWLYTWDRMGQFLRRFVWNRELVPGGTAPR